MKKECIAMLLAGGEGKRLGALTDKLAKPAVPFGGKYRIIDFSLSNCTNSGIDTVGILTQYQPMVLHGYIGSGNNWGLNKRHGGTVILPPFVQHKGGRWYNGTANAVYQNLYYLEQFDPEYVLVISGDHIYKMDYSLMLDYHKAKNADVTIAVIDVPWEEASRFGTVIANEEHRIRGFEEKPKHPKSNLVSMGIYIFNRKLLSKYLQQDEKDENSTHDFGRDVIPHMLQDNNKLFAYYFNGYWKDVGTVTSLWKANMDLLTDNPELDLYEDDKKVYTVNKNLPPQYISPQAKINKAIIATGCLVYGEVQNSIIFSGVYIGENTVVKDSIVFPNSYIGANVKIYKSIIGSDCRLEDGCQIGNNAENAEITVVGNNKAIYNNLVVAPKLLQSL